MATRATFCPVPVAVSAFPTAFITSAAGMPPETTGRTTAISGDSQPGHAVPESAVTIIRRAISGTRDTRLQMTGWKSAEKHERKCGCFRRKLRRFGTETTEVWDGKFRTFNIRT